MGYGEVDTSDFFLTPLGCEYYTYEASRPLSSRNAYHIDCVGTVDLFVFTRPALGGDSRKVLLDDLSLRKGPKPF
jgi:hypothetical protein